MAKGTMCGVGRIIKNMFLRAVKSGKSVVRNPKEFAEVANKTIHYVSFENNSGHN